MSQPINVQPITNFVNVTIVPSAAGQPQFAYNNILMIDKETPIQALGGPYGVYSNTSQVASDWGTGSEAYAQATEIFSQLPNPLSANGQLLIWPMASNDTITTAVLAASNDVFFGGVLVAGYTPNDAEVLAGANTVQSMLTMLANSQSSVTAIQGGGSIANITTAGLSKTRGFLYTQAGTALGARIAAAGYFGRVFSVDFSGSAVALNMSLKQLVGVLPDQGLNPTNVALAATAGADIYTFIGNTQGVTTSGANTFIDQIYNLNWLQGAVQVAIFNALATTATKIPQTESGMQILKSAIATVLQQAVNAGVIAPGAWNSPTTFGDPVVLNQNILQIGWYIYSQPVNQQSQAQRVARQAPLIQVAVKLAGAINTSNTIIYVNP